MGRSRQSVAKRKRDSAGEENVPVARREDGSDVDEQEDWDRDYESTARAADDEPYPHFFVGGLAIGGGIGQAVGGSTGMVIGLVVGGGVGKALGDAIRKRWRQRGASTDVASSSNASRWIPHAIVTTLVLAGLYYLLRNHTDGQPQARSATGASDVVPPTAGPTTGYARLLAQLGYDQSIIDRPMPVRLFTAIRQPAARLVFSGELFEFGWYANDAEGDIELAPVQRGTLTGALPVAFDPGPGAFGFFIKMNTMGVTYRWHSQQSQNRGVEIEGEWVSDLGADHVKVYPTIVDGERIPNSYLLCWEDYPLSQGPSPLIDFSDLIVRIDGVAPATN